ncbi:MAG: hypothetical protein ACOH2E_06235, partial [Candidatus Paracaedibacter sp.]
AAAKAVLKLGRLRPSFFIVPKEDVKDDHRAQLVHAHLKKYPPISVVLKKGRITKIFRHQR